MRSNQNLNYYKFGLGLGVTPGALEKRNVPDKNGKKGDKKGEAADAQAGGADQYVLEMTPADVQAHHN